MSYVDFGIIILLVAFVLYGFKFGLVHTLGGIVGAIVAFFIASKLYLPFAASGFGTLVGGNTTVGKFLAFTLIFVILARLIGLVVWGLDKIFNFIAVIPLVGPANRLAGAVFGFFEGIIILAGVVYIAGKYPVVPSFGIALATSRFAFWLNLIAKLLEPLLPDALSSLRSVFDAPSGKAADYIRQYFKF